MHLLSIFSIVRHWSLNSVLPLGQIFELYAAEDSMVAARYFYTFKTLHLTELSQRYDTLVLP